MLRAYQCPFFRWEEKRKIHCEGGQLCFPDLDSMGEYIDKFCAKSPGWQSCSVAGNMQDYYRRKK